MGGGGMDDTDLSQGAVAAMLRVADQGLLRPVLQVLIPPRQSVAMVAGRYMFFLSDGVEAQLGMLAASLSHLVRGGDLRGGTVVRILDYICSTFHGERVIIVIQLEILRTECAPISIPRINPPCLTQPFSGGLGSHEPFLLPGAQKFVDNLSCFPGQGVLDSSFAPWAEHAVDNLQYGGCYGSILPQNTVAAKMQKLSLDNHQGQRFPVTTTVENFGAGSTFGSSLPPEYLQPSPVRTDRSCAAMNEAPNLVTPISALKPYKFGWTIKARATAKTDLRYYGNTRVPRRFFSFDLVDAQGGEIRVTCFNSQADQYFDLIEVDKVYLMSGGIVIPAQTKYCTLNADYEICVDNSTSIQVCSDDDSSIPGQQYNFRKISEIVRMENGSLVDLLVVVTYVNPSATIMRNDGTGSQKRTLLLKDMSDRSMEMTLWEKFCDSEGQKLQYLFDSGSNPVLAIKGCRVIEFIGKSLTTISSTQLKVNPDFPEAERLRQWYLTEGKTADQEVSSVIRNHIIKPIALIKDENLGKSGKPDFITVRARILQVKANNFCYPACTLMFNGRQCNAKVTKNKDGTWNCNRCALNLPKCEYRYLLTCWLQDPTGTTYATAFNETGTEIIGCSAEELFIGKDQDEAKWEEIMLRVCQHDYLFKLRVKEETFNGEAHVKCNIVSAEKLDT